MTFDFSPEALQAIIVHEFPELSEASFEVLTMGWDSVAVDVDNRWIFKFPRNDLSLKALIKEAGLLDIVRPQITLSVPQLTIYTGAMVFSRHKKILGDYLLTPDYEKLNFSQRQHLARDIALFYSELHRLDSELLFEAGAEPIWGWPNIEDLYRKAVPAPPLNLQPYAVQTLEAFENLSPDPYGIVYGFFDGHGWNMAFDHTTGQLNGIYDFADSGLGPLHQDFIYTNFISRDLTLRIVDEYEAITGLQLQSARIDLLTGVLRLVELANLADSPEHEATIRDLAVNWKWYQGMS